MGGVSKNQDGVKIEHVARKLPELVEITFLKVLSLEKIFVVTFNQHKQQLGILKMLILL